MLSDKAFMRAQIYTTAGLTTLGALLGGFYLDQTVRYERRTSYGRVLTSEPSFAGGATLGGIGGLFAGAMLAYWAVGRRNERFGIYNESLFG